MPTAPGQVFGLQVQSLECGEILAAQASEIVQELLQSSVSTLPRLSEAIKRIEWPRFAMLEYDARPRHPVGALADDQMAQDVERVPCVGSLIAPNPDVGESAQQHVQACRCAGENCEGLGQAEFWNGRHAHVDASPTVWTHGDGRFWFDWRLGYTSTALISLKEFPMDYTVIRRTLLSVFLLAGVLALLAADTATQPAPPIAKKVPKITEINGRKLVDNYFWLRDKPNPEVKAYLEAENAYTDALMKPTESFQKKLYDEMLSRVKETDVEVPYKEGEYFYYTRSEAGKQYGIRCRKKGSMDATEEIVLDVNELAKGQAFLSVQAYAVSEHGDLLAYTTDNTGFRQFTLAVKDLGTGQLLADHAERVGSVVWATDNKTIFYTVEDAVSKRQYRLYRHTAGTAGPDDQIYEEKDERFDVEVDRTRSKGYIFLVSASHTTSEARYIPASQPMAEWKVLEPRKQDVEYYPDHNGDFFYIRVNDTGRNFRLVKAPLSDPRSENWREVVPERAAVMLDDMDFFRNYYITYERENGLPQIRVTHLSDGQSRRVEFPEPAYLAYSYVNREYDAPKFRY